MHNTHPPTFMVKNDAQTNFRDWSPDSIASPQLMCNPLGDIDNQSLWPPIR